MNALQAEYAALADSDLLARARLLARSEADFTLRLIACLSVVDERRLYQPKYASLFEYCREELGLEEAAAFKRIRAARLVRDYPSVLSRLQSGEISLSGLVELAPHMTAENHEKLMEDNKGKSKRDIERYVADLAPRSDRRDEVKPLGRGRVHLSFTAGQELAEGIEQARNLLRHRFPEGRLEDILRTALEAWLLRNDPALKQPGGRRHKLNGVRRIPQWIRDQVWKRDEGRCSMVVEGRRCGSMAWVEYDHIVPWAAGGTSDDVSNIRLLCRAHNQWRAKA